MRRTFRHVAGAGAGVMLMASALTAASAAAASQGIPSGLDAVAPTASAFIIGTAWKADNSPIPKAKVRLRNVVTGKIEAMAVANEAGKFVFGDIEEGSYIVELVSDSGKILAVGQALAVGPGETILTFVRIGAKVPWFDGFFGNAAAIVAAAAASTGVTAVAPEQMRPVSPQK